MEIQYVQKGHSSGRVADLACSARAIVDVGACAAHPEVGDVGKIVVDWGVEEACAAGSSGSHAGLGWSSR